VRVQRVRVAMPPEFSCSCRASPLASVVSVGACEMGVEDSCAISSVLPWDFDEILSCSLVISAGLMV